MARDGFEIWLNYRSDESAAQAVARDIESGGGRCRLLKFDVADEAAVREVLGPLLDERAPAVLVNNAGFARDALFVWMTRAEWRDTLAVTLDGFFHVTKPILLAMLKKRAGSIVNIVSTSGQTGVPGQANYSAAKGGLIAATRSLAVEVAKRNVRVNAVAPGFHRDGHDQGSAARQNPAEHPAGPARAPRGRGRSGLLSLLARGLVHRRAGALGQRRNVFVAGC